MNTKIYFLTLLMIFGTKIVSGQITLTYFTGNQSGSNFDLSWESTTEINMDYYAVERSLDSINYTDVQNIVASGNTFNPISYSYTDSYSFTDICYYYRLKSIHFDGSFEYSDTIKLCFDSSIATIDKLEGNSFFNIYPNPITNNQLTVQLLGNENCTLNVLNQMGQNILSITTNSPISLIDCSRFKIGLYYLQVVKNNGFTNTVKFIIE